MLLSLHEFRELMEQALPRNADHVRVAIPGDVWYDAHQGLLRFDGETTVKTIYKFYEDTSLEEYVEDRVATRFEEERAADADEEAEDKTK